MKRALFLSPHLDDVVFSCGATLALLMERGWEATVVTVFTGNVTAPQGFALECQTSKGIAPEVDYMELRRDEDLEAFAHLGDLQLYHWGLLEAPHRGYHSPPELFAGVRDDDDMGQQIKNEIAGREELQGDFDAVFAPQGLGNHVDHLHVIGAAHSFHCDNLLWYRDTPYAIREPEARPSPQLSSGLDMLAVEFGQSVLERKIKACSAYASQIGFQFGGPQAVRDKLTDFHRAEAGRVGASPYAELFLHTPDAAPLF